MTYGERYPRLLELPGHEAYAATEMPTGPPPPPTAAAEAAIRLAMRAELCPFGSGPCGCGDGPDRACSRYDRPDHVRRADCLRCVSGRW